MGVQTGSSQTNPTKLLGYNFIEKTLRPQKNMLGCPLDLHLLLLFIQEKNMALIATVAAIGTFIAATLFSLSLLKEVITGK